MPKIQMWGFLNFIFLKKIALIIIIIYVWNNLWQIIFWSLRLISGFNLVHEVLKATLKYFRFAKQFKIIHKLS